MNGKGKCRQLKEIRRRIAEANDIELVTHECTYQGACTGTCPRCEAELRELERGLEARRRVGKTVAVAALAAGVALTAGGCSLNPAASLVRTVIEGAGTDTELSGDVMYTGTPEPDMTALSGMVAMPTELPDTVELTGETANEAPQ